eukprot:1763558-Amphidinium_carterae.1
MHFHLEVQQLPQILGANHFKLCYRKRFSCGAWSMRFAYCVTSWVPESLRVSPQGLFVASPSSGMPQAAV